MGLFGPLGIITKIDVIKRASDADWSAGGLFDLTSVLFTRETQFYLRFKVFPAVNRCHLLQYLHTIASYCTKRLIILYSLGWKLFVRGISVQLHIWQVEETAKRATKPNRAYQARSSLEINRFDHPSEDSGRMRTLRSRAAVQTWTSVRRNVVDTIKSNTRRCVYMCSCMCTFTKVE